MQAKIKKDGMEATVRSINGGAREFDYAGAVHAKDGTPAVAAKNVYDLPLDADPRGRHDVRGIVDG